MNRTPTVYTFMGFSGAGKDTAATVFKSAKVIKFASPGKRALEVIYKLPEGFMDDRVKRMEIAPYSEGLTYLDVLIKFWKYRDLVIGSTLFGEQTKAEILSTLASGTDVVITDMRNFNELDVIADIDDMGYTVVPTWIEGGAKLESDVHQDKLFSNLCLYNCNPEHHINNDSPTAHHWRVKMAKWLIDNGLAQPVDLTDEVLKFIFTLVST